jgi:DNA-binding LacI/PurR family transcriptional regulator
MSTPLEQVRAIALEMPGRKMPGERDLAARLGIGRKQVRAALAVLEHEGLIVRRQGSGTFAADTRVAKSMTVALLVDAALRLGDDPFFSTTVDQLQRALQLAGMRCLVQRVSEDHPAIPRADAAITVGLAGATVIAALDPGSSPVVGLLLPESAFRPDRRVTLLLADDRMAGVRAAERLIERGCGSLIFAGMNDLPMSRQRLLGAHRIAESAKVSIRAIKSGSNFQSGLLVSRTLSSAPEHGPVGIIAANDWMAVGMQAGLMSRGLLGEDGQRYHIVGFDGLDIAADPALAIDSIMFPIDTIIDDAVAELIRLTSSSAIPGRIIRYAPQWR